MTLRQFGFSDVGLEVWGVAAGLLVLLILALLAASVSVFIRNVPHFQDDVREATMALSPAMRRRFYEIYDARKPRDPAIAWFLAIGFGPIGVNWYRGEGRAFVAALVSLNGLGAWWLESWFTAPQFVLIENRALIEQSLSLLQDEAERAAVVKVEAAA
jgi:hypothetical protein